MKNKPARGLRNRRGTIVILAAIMMIALLGMAAFSVDYGYILTARTDLQAAADAAVLAAARELVPDENGSQYYSIHLTREKVRDYVNANINSAEWFQIPDDDIEIGRYDTSTVYSGAPLTLLQDGTFDTVRVTLRQGGANNDGIPLFFARALGFDEADIQVTATALLPPAKAMTVGSGVLPFAVHIDEWNDMSIGTERSIYGDGHIEDNNGNHLGGNWGTVDIGEDNNSANDMRDQIREGLRQSDLDALAADVGPDGLPRIPDNTELQAPVWVNGDTGLSAGIQSAVEDIMFTPRLIPIYDDVSGPGNNSEFHIVCWGVVEVIDVDLRGNLANKHLTIRRGEAYMGKLTANTDLSDTSNTIQGAVAAAMLVE